MNDRDTHTHTHGHDDTTHARVHTHKEGIQPTPYHLGKNMNASTQFEDRSDQTCNAYSSYKSVEGERKKNKYIGLKFILKTN